MPTAGQRTTTGRTADATVTRDRLITMAFENIKILEEGGTLSSEKLQAGIDRLNLIIRELDESGRWRWTVPSAAHLTLAANVGIYEASNGLPTNITELLSVVYRDGRGRDSDPLKILSAESYEKLSDKLEDGEPRAVYLTDDIAIERRRLYLWPIPSTITTQSKVLGTDNNSYKCIYPHTSSLTTRPTDGPNWKMVWELSSAAGSAWAASTDYTASESLRLVIRRPIFDFDSADNTPDIPPQMMRLLLYRLCSDLADAYPSEGVDRETLNGKVKGAYTDIFPSTRTRSNDVHNKGKYF